MNKAGKIAGYLLGTILILVGFFSFTQAILTSQNPLAVGTVNVELFLTLFLFAIGGAVIYYTGKNSEKRSKYICGHCNAIFESEINLKIHYDSKHFSKN
ncbi:MAG: hypothetical protein WBV92_09050 [Nitrosotalea sp.]